MNKAAAFRSAGVVVALTVATGAGGAIGMSGTGVNVCHGIKRCVPVEGPWVVVRAGGGSDFLLSCPARGVVAGVDALATTTAVRLSFDGRLGAPIAPGVTTTTSAFFRALLVEGRVAEFQPWLGCVALGGGGRSTVSMRVAPGSALQRRSRIVRLTSGEARTERIGCPGDQRFAGGWGAVAFYTKRPNLRDARLVRASVPPAMESSREEIVHAAAGSALPASAHALIEVGAACAP